MDDRLFVTPEGWEAMRKKQLAGPNGWLLFVACNSGADLANRVKTEYESALDRKGSELKEIPLLSQSEDFGPMTVKFKDTETRPRLPEHVAGSNVFIFQQLASKVDDASTNDNIMQMLQMIRTLRVHRAKHITAVTPYLSYSRQDRPTFGRRESTTAKLLADLMITAGVDEVLAYHLHNDSIQAFYEPHGVVALTGLDLFLEIFSKYKGMRDAVAVSTDAGGAKLTITFAEQMEISYAIASKYRPADQESDVLGIVGNFEGKRIAIIGDDETVTAGSIANAAKVLSTEYDIDEVYAAISHNKLTEGAIQRLSEAHHRHNLRELHVTDSIPQTQKVLDLSFLVVHPLAERLARTINRMHYNQSVKELFYGRT